MCFGYSKTPFLQCSVLLAQAYCAVYLATDCHSAVLAAPAGVFLHTILISSIVQIFLAVYAVPAVPIMVDLFLHVSSESGLCFRSVR